MTTKERVETTASPTAMGLMKYVYVMYFAGALLLAWLLFNLVTGAWTYLNLTVRWVTPPIHGASVLAAGGVAAIVAWNLWRNQKINRLAVEIVNELSKVTWPTRKELSAATVVVIVISVIASVILGLFDFFWAWFTDLIYS